MVYHVHLSRRVQKQLVKVPRYIVSKLKAWIEAVETEGLQEVRKIPGYHDEALHGERKGQRSIRLSRAYRAIYTNKTDHSVELLIVKELSKHAY